MHLTQKRYFCIGMKNNFLTFLSVLLAILIAYCGSGVNIFFYCCDDCRSEGTEAVIGGTCCELHHHHTCNQHLANAPDKCGVERISVLWESNSNNNPGVEPFCVYIVHSLSALISSSKLSSDIIPLIGFENPASQKPPHLSKEEYFSLLTTLII